MPSAVVDESPSVTDHVERRPEGTRLHILQSAAHRMAGRPYSQVNLDDILEDAKVTKGALYFHFRSKLELAEAIVEYWADGAATLFRQPHFASLPGLEAMIEMCYVIAVEDIGARMARAGFNLLESLGRFDGLQNKLLSGWVTSFTDLTRRAADDGDVMSDVDHTHVARVVVSLYMGLRQTSDLDDPSTFLYDLEAAWLLALPSFVPAERLVYMRSFVRRRTALAIKNATPFRADNL